MFQEFNSYIHSYSNDELSQDSLKEFQHNYPFLQNGYDTYLRQQETDYNSKSLDTIQNNNSPSLNDVKNTICNPDFISMNIEQAENEVNIHNAIFYKQKQKKDENIKSENNENEKSIQCNELQNNNNNNNPNEDLNNNKEIKRGKKGPHNKYFEDNISNKIKTFLINHFLIKK